jgi:CheY-like chemotaxis protein
MILTKTHDVLVVEDDQELREAVGSILQEEGCSVRSASNGAEALTLLHGQERPCIILLDLMMPVMNGWQFLEQRKSDVQGRDPRRGDVGLSGHARLRRSPPSGRGDAEKTPGSRPASGFGQQPL